VEAAAATTFLQSTQMLAPSASSQNLALGKSVVVIVDSVVQIVHSQLNCSVGQSAGSVNVIRIWAKIIEPKNFEFFLLNKTCNMANRIF